MKSRPSALRDFTVDRRSVASDRVSLVIGTGAAGARCASFACDRIRDKYLLLPPASARDGWAGRITQLSPSLYAAGSDRWGPALVGLMAHYGSDKIRGHGIPEAIEAILLNGARVDPKVALLKPLSAAIAIGSGWTFRCGRADHHDRWSVRLAGRAVAQSCQTPNGPHCWWPAPLRGCQLRLRRRLPRFCLPWSCFSSSGVRVRSSQ